MSKPISLGASDQVIWQAIQAEMASRPDYFLFQAYDWEVAQITYNEDGTQAVVSLNPLDPDTGMTIATEPLLAIANHDPTLPATEANAWQIIMQGDSDWVSEADKVTGLLPIELVENLSAPESLSPEAPLAALGGFKLPWAAGLTKTLEWSAEHTSCPGSDCVYAFDFADGTMFPLLAAKGGAVFYAKDTCTNGATDCTNIFIIKDVSTYPTSYQIYYHLAQGTIPAALHSVGAVVSQGQYIGNVDDTGYSSGHHLHFMVHASSYGYWGPSVDITFRDVPINWDSATQGGRPRTLAGTSILGGQWQTDYTSGNTGTNPPTGGLTLPADKTTVTNPTIVTSGWGTDNLGVTRLQLIAFHQGAWHDVGESQSTSPFSYALDVCSAGIPPGPFDLALRVWDIEGNQSLTPLGTRHLVNTLECMQSAPSIRYPNDNEVVIYNGINYTGAYKVLGIGSHDYTQFGSVLNNDAASVLVGRNVQIRMYDGEVLSNRRETLTSSDRNLGDNPIGIDHLSSASVQYRSLLPTLELDGTDPHGPSALAPTTLDSITVTWRADGATKYQTRIFSGFLSSIDQCGTMPPLISRSPDWTSSPSWSIGTLLAGEYTWCARGRIADQYATQYYSPWQMKTFTVSSASFLGQPTRSVPYLDGAESGVNDWTASGLWRQIYDPEDVSNHMWICNNSGGDYADSTYGGGDLTSPPIFIPAEGASLRFDYRYETESDQPFWDQRWVQISQNGGRFQNLVQLSDDPMNQYLRSPYIDLSAYAGSTVRIRFHFSIVDKHYNGSSGWSVDNVLLAYPQSMSCAESSNNLPSSAGNVSLGGEAFGTICPAGDVDFYRFYASAGTRLIAQVDASILDPVSALDPDLSVLDQDQYGNTLLYENDDLQPGVMTDSRVYFTVPETGNYYLKVKSSDHPTSGGDAYSYRLSLVQQVSASDITPPDLHLIYPTLLDGVPSSSTIFSASAQDFGSEVERVEFWWHSPDWTGGQWSLLAADTYGNDGWQAPFVGNSYSEGQSGSLVVIAYDYQGNSRVVVDWNVSIDDTPPFTGMIALPAVNDGTSVLLSWTAGDVLSRVSTFDVQFQVDDSNWMTWRTAIPGSVSSTWFTGEPGRTYAFRIRGIDTAGNTEEYPTEAEAVTSIGMLCTPDGYDGLGDQVPAQAGLLEINNPQEHVFCAGDVDWIAFAAEEGREYLIRVNPTTASPVGSSLELFQTDESGWLFSTSTPAPGLPLEVRWEAPANGVYLLRLAPLDARIFGNNARYTIRVGDGWWFNFPVLFN